jgi:hypothetical protein
MNRSPALSISSICAFCLVALSFAVHATRATEPQQPVMGKLSFGWATESIVPNRPVAIGGQYHTRISGEVHDPITVTALAMETKHDVGTLDQVIWVSCDLCVVRRSTVENVRKLVAKSIPDFDTAKLIVSATHTHTGPALTDTDEVDLHPYDFVRSWAYRIPSDVTNIMRPREYLAFLERQIALAVVRAWESRQPGEMSCALSHASIARNRRAVYFDGTTRMYGDTRDPNFSHTEGTSDDSLDVLFLWRNDKLIGTAITVYCPSQEVEGESYLSADFWADAREQLREKFSPDLFVLPLTGASGDQSPHVQIDKVAVGNMLDRRQESYRQEIGRRIVNGVLDVAELGKESRQSEIVLSHRVDRVPLSVWKVSEERFQQATEFVNQGKDRLDELSGPDYIQWRVQQTMMERYALQQTEATYAAEIHAVRLNQLAYVTNPFELYTDYSNRMKARSPAIQTSVVQLTADCAAYLPTERAVQGGGYSARIDDGVVGPQGGRELVEATVRMLKQLWPKE